MANQNQATWKKVFDSLDRTLGSRINDFVRSEDFATLAALGHRAQTMYNEMSERMSRRALHAMNLPAGSDVNRLLAQLALLEREVRDLRKEVEQQSAQAPPAAAPARPRSSTNRSASGSTNRSTTGSTSRSATGSTSRSTTRAKAK